MAGPLEGIKVLEVANWLAVPSTAALMADMGASVIKVESPEGDSWRHWRSNDTFDFEFPTSYPFEMDNRGKRGIALNLAKDEAVDIVCKLAEKADVFMTNLIPKRMERFRLRYEDLRPNNPDIIYLSFNAYGAEGPEKDRTGFDLNAFWARSGMCSVMREPGQSPVELRSGFGDHVSSAVLLSGVLAALIEKERTGKGQALTASLLNIGLWVLGADVAEAAAAGNDPKLWSRDKKPFPDANFYQTKDGKWFNVLIGNVPGDNKVWQEFCKALGRDDLAADPRFNTFEGRQEHSEYLIAEFDKEIGAFTMEEMVPVLDAYASHWAPVQTITEAINDPQTKANRFFTTLEHPTHGSYRTLNMPVRFDRSEVHPRGPAPELSQHTEEVLLELGYDWDDISKLKDKGVIL